MSKLTKKKKKLNTANTLTATQISASLTNTIANVSNEAYSGMDLLRTEGERLINVLVDKKQGNLFEIIERTKFNMDAALKNSPLRAVTTAELGYPHHRADIFIENSGKKLAEVQAKSSSKAVSALHEISNEKYNGMQKLFNPENVDRARELAKKRIDSGTLKASEYEDTSKNMTGKLKYNQISSSGTTHEEAMKAAHDYNGYSANFEFNQFKKEFTQSVKVTAITSSIISGGISIVKNGMAYSQNKIDKNILVGNILIDTTKAAVKGGATGGVSTGVRTIAQKSGNSVLGKTNIATSIAVGIIDSGVTVVDYVKGDITTEQAMIQIGEKGFNTMSSIYSGIAAGVVFGPGGVLIGSLIGYMVASNVYFTCIDTLNHSALRVEEASRLIALYDESIRIRSEERARFETYIKARLTKNAKQFNDVIAIMEKGIRDNDIGSSIRGMELLANYFGKELKYAKFEDFDLVMQSDEMLVL